MLWAGDAPNLGFGSLSRWQALRADPAPMALNARENHARSLVRRVDPSMFTRNVKPSLRRGNVGALRIDDRFERTSGDQRVTVAFNLGGTAREWPAQITSDDAAPLSANGATRVLRPAFAGVAPSL